MSPCFAFKNDSLFSSVLILITVYVLCTFIVWLLDCIFTDNVDACSFVYHYFLVYRM